MFSRNRFIIFDNNNCRIIISFNLIKKFRKFYRKIKKKNFHQKFSNFLPSFLLVDLFGNYGRISKEPKKTGFDVEAKTSKNLYKIQEYKKMNKKIESFSMSHSLDYFSTNENVCLYNHVVFGIIIFFLFKFFKFQVLKFSRFIFW